MPVDRTLTTARGGTSRCPPRSTPDESFLAAPTGGHLGVNRQAFAWFVHVVGRQVLIVDAAA